MSAEKRIVLSYCVLEAGKEAAFLKGAADAREQ